MTHDNKNGLNDWFVEFAEKAASLAGSRASLPLSYGFAPDQTRYLLKGEVLCINVYPLLSQLSFGETKGFCEALLDSILSASPKPLELVEPQGILLEDILGSWPNGYRFENHGHDRLIQLNWCFLAWAKKTGLPWKKPVSSISRSRFASPGLYVRPGIVELRALQGYLLTPEKIRADLLEIMAHIDDENYLYATSRVPMWNTRDTHFNLRRLMTNAGFYADSETSWDSLCRWSEDYFTALATGTILYHNQAVWYSFSVLESIYRLAGTLPVHQYPPHPPYFYSAMAGRKILFLTPFASEIKHLVTTQKIRQLYRHIQVPPFELDTLQAFISTYPNRPHGSYRETFEILKASLDRTLATGHYDLFIASCGCYGLPLCLHVYQQHGITAVYMGNTTNTLFGILQNTSLDFQKNNRIEENWIRGDLSQHANMHRIDKGRYV